MTIAKKLALAEQICGHTFKNRDLLQSAITHPSAVEGQPVSASYERLEFLGDSILGSIVALSLFKLGIDKCIVFGASETGTGARGMHSALENVFESLVGAMYLDGGWDVAEEFVHRTLKPHLATERAEHPTNPKSYLQECVQADHLEAPSYKLVDTSGPAHEPVFTAVAFVDGIRRGRGSGSSKKEAEAAAALDALNRMGYTHNGVILKKKLG